MKYSLEELRLLCFVLRVHRANRHNTALKERTESDREPDHPDSDDLEDSHHKYRLTLTDSQIKAIDGLEYALSNHSYTSKELRIAIEGLLDALYMPDNTMAMVENTYISPVSAMICLRAVGPDGSFLHPKIVTCNLVGIQCGNRLRIFRRAMILLAEISKRATNDSDWFR